MIKSETTLESIKKESNNPRWLLLLVVGIPLAFWIWLANWLWTTDYSPAEQYRLYLLEDRKGASLSWDSISVSWTESDFKTKFQGYTNFCTSKYYDQTQFSRACVARLKSLNGVPTMYVTYFFTNDQLQRVVAAIPWWNHLDGLRYLNATYGYPQGADPDWASGTPVIGWQLQDGNALFYNKHKNFNPLQVNTIQWLSPSQCAPDPCISPKQ